MQLYAVVTAIVFGGIGLAIWLLVRTWKAGWKDAADEVGPAKFTDGVRWGIAEAQAQFGDIEKRAYERGLAAGVQLALAAPQGTKSLPAPGAGQ